MKKKLLSFILAICLMMPCALVLTACGGSKDPEHTHEYETTWSTSSTHHWYACKGDDCSEKKDNATHSFANYVCSVCGYQDTSVPPVLQTATESFTGAKATFAKTTYKDALGNVTTMEKLLDAQIDVLAQDLLYRLTYVYGYNNDNHNKTTEAKQLKTLDSNGAESDTYAYNGKNAVVDRTKLLQSTSVTHDSTHTLTNLDLSCLDCYQITMEDTSSIEDSDSLLYEKRAISFAGAIEGRYAKLDIDELDASPDENYAWNWYDSATLTNTTYLNYSKAYKNNLKMAIAEMLSNKTTLTGQYDKSNYDEMLTSIKSLGYFSSNKETLIKFIKEEIVGGEITVNAETYSLVSFDDKIYDYWNMGEGYIVKNNFKNKAPYDDSDPDEGTESTFTSEQIAYSPRLYKGYSIVVPAIVEQALANTFEGTTTSLYPKMTRTAVKTTDSATGFSEELPYNSLTIKPKAGTKATKLVVSFQGVADSIGKTISVNYAVQIGTNVASATKQVELSATATEVEFDLNSLMNSASFSAYNGNDVVCEDGIVYAVNEFDGDQLADTDGTSYIKLNFSGLDGESMKIELKGLYDKV